MRSPSLIQRSPSRTLSVLPSGGYFHNYEPKCLVSRWLIHKCSVHAHAARGPGVGRLGIWVWNSFYARFLANGMGVISLIHVLCLVYHSSAHFTQSAPACFVVAQYVLYCRSENLLRFVFFDGHCQNLILRISFFVD